MLAQGEHFPAMILAMNSGDALDISGLKFCYPGSSNSDSWALEISQLQLNRGEQLLLRGGSGQGKSTLLQLIAGLMDPTEGTILIDSEDLHKMHGARRDLFRGAKVGMIFQTFNLLHGFSAAENVMTAMMFSNIPRKEHKERAYHLLDHLGIDQPDRYPSKMSVGQQQRIAVARAVACDPVLVLADEPTASLDPENAETAVNLIELVCEEKNAALLCVSHDPLMADRFERVESLGELTGSTVDGN